MLIDQMKRWLPMFGGAWLAAKVLLAKAMLWSLNFLAVMEWSSKHDALDKFVRAIGLNLEVATSMDTGAAAFLVAGLFAKCWSLWKAWRAAPAPDQIANPARLTP